MDILERADDRLEKAGHMRVGVYIDGLNLYYGGRKVVGRGQPGWRWLDLRKLSQRLLDGRPAWLARGATLQRIVYCTAFIAGSYNAEGRRNQDRYIAALRQQGSFDVFEKGRFVKPAKDRSPWLPGDRGASRS